MTFDPFGDYSTRGYLRNTRGADEVTVKRLEHAAFRASLDSALDYLKAKPQLTYEDVLQTHAKLFSSVYPWAGQDRTTTAPDSAIGKNGNFSMFSHPAASRLAVEQALHMASNRNTMRSKPGEVMGLLAHAHPFLDGNGRTIMTVHIELCRRAGMSIDWSQTNKKDYIEALTKELEDPGKGHLDSYLKPYMRLVTVDQVNAAVTLSNLPGLGPAENPTYGPVFIPRRDMDTAVTASEVDAACFATSWFKDTNRNLERMAANVYKDPNEVINDIREAAMTGPYGDRSVVKRIELDPESYGPYKGAGGVFSSLQERKDYRNAIAARSGLWGIADNLIAGVHGLRQSLASDKQQLADRGKVEIRLPDSSLSHAIEKKLPLSEAQVAEIDKAIRLFEHRFGDDIGKVRTARNLDPLAQKHGLDVHQLTMARQVLKSLDKGRSLAQEQSLDLRRAHEPSKAGPTR